MPGSNSSSSGIRVTVKSEPIAIALNEVAFGVVVRSGDRVAVWTRRRVTEHTDSATRRVRVHVLRAGLGVGVGPAARARR